MTGDASAHSLAVELSLRRLLVELGACAPTTSIFLVVSDLDRLGDIVGKWRERNAPALNRLASSH